MSIKNFNSYLFHRRVCFRYIYFIILLVTNLMRVFLFKISY